MLNFNQQYINVLKEIMFKGYIDINERTGVEVKALPGINIQVDLQKEFPLVSLRKIFPKSAIAEVMWFISGEKNTNVFLSDHTKIWDLFKEENGEVETAYGYRWRHHFGRDQLKELVNLLKKEPTSRHGVIVTWDPSDDGLLGPKKKNVPCPFTFTVNIMESKLHLHNIIRSNDMVLGFPTDVATFSLLTLILAQELEVKPGIYTHSISNAHIYNNHYKGVKEMIKKQPFIMDPFSLPKDCYNRAKDLDETLFKELIEIFNSNYSSYKFMKGLTIAV